MSVAELLIVVGGVEDLDDKRCKTSLQTEEASLISEILKSADVTAEHVLDMQLFEQQRYSGCNSGVSRCVKGPSTTQNRKPCRSCNGLSWGRRTALQGHSDLPCFSLVAFAEDARYWRIRV